MTPPTSLQPPPGEPGTLGMPHGRGPDRPDGGATVRRLAILLAAAAMAGEVLVGCGGESTAGAAAPSAPAVSTAATGPSVLPAPAGPATRTLSIMVRGGQPSGDTGRVKVALGTPVTLAVSSDVADMVHVHGYDKEAQIPAGETGSVSFTADIPGVFEVELHESGLQLLQLQVN